MKQIASNVAGPSIYPVQPQPCAYAKKASTEQQTAANVLYVMQAVRTALVAQNLSVMSVMKVRT